MKKIYLLLLFFSIHNRLLSQALCDEKVCIVSSDVYNKPSEEVILQKSIEEKKKLENSGHKFDVSCEYPSFWFYNNNGKKVVKEAKAEGLTSVVAENKQKQRCDLLKSPLFVPIQFNGGTNYAVNDCYGDAVFIDKSFIFLIEDKDYWCYGLPIEPTRYIKCNKCGTIYKTQKFKSIDRIIRDIYIMASKCLNGNNHDNLELEDIGKCSVTKGRTIPTE